MLKPKQRMHTLDNVKCVHGLVSSLTAIQHVCTIPLGSSNSDIRAHLTPRGLVIGPASVWVTQLESPSVSNTQWCDEKLQDDVSTGHGSCCNPLCSYTVCVCVCVHVFHRAGMTTWYVTRYWHIMLKLFICNTASSTLPVQQTPRDFILFSYLHVVDKSSS